MKGGKGKGGKGKGKGDRGRVLMQFCMYVLSWIVVCLANSVFVICVDGLIERLVLLDLRLHATDICCGNMIVFMHSGKLLSIFMSLMTF